MHKHLQRLAAVFYLKVLDNTLAPVNTQTDLLKYIPAVFCSSSSKPREDISKILQFCHGHDGRYTHLLNYFRKYRWKAGNTSRGYRSPLNIFTSVLLQLCQLLLQLSLYCFLFTLQSSVFESITMELLSELISKYHSALTCNRLNVIAFIVITTLTTVCWPAVLTPPIRDQSHQNRHEQQFLKVSFTKALVLPKILKSLVLRFYKSNFE